jgi:hypothetical protein
MALSTVTRAEVGNVNKDEDLGKVVKDVPLTPDGESSGDGEVAGQVDPNYVPILPFTEE